MKKKFPQIKPEKFMYNKFFSRIISLLLISSVSMSVFGQMKVGDNPAVINANSALEIESTNKGVLLPRLGLSATTNVAPLSAHIAGMVVYNTATAGDVTPGFYYNDGTKWVRLFSASTALNTTASNNLVTITNGTGATLTAMTVGVDTTQLKSFLAGKVTSVVNAPLSGNGTTASPISITTGDLSVGTLLATTGSPTAALLKTAGYRVDTTALKTFISNAISNGFITGRNTTAGPLTTIANGTGATLTAMTVGVDTAALKTFVSGSIAKNTTAGSLVTVTNGTGAALVNNTVAVDTTALKSFLTGKVSSTTSAPITGDGTVANPISVTRATATSGVLTTVSNGTNAAFTALKYDVDTTALKSFLTGKVSSTTSAPITGDGTVANPISVTRATATSGVLTTVSNGTNAAFTALKYDVDTTALKSFISSSVGKNTTAGSLVTVTNGTGAALVNNTVAVDTTALKTFLNNKVTVTASAPLTGNGTTASPLAVTQATATNGVLTTVTNGTNATFTALKYDVDTTALKTFLAGKVNIVASAPLTGAGTTASPLAVTQATATNGILTTVTNGTNATFTALKYDVDTTALKTFINGRTTNTLTNPTNTITSTVNGVAATAPAVNTVSNSFTVATRALTTTVNGVAGTAVTLTDGPDSTTANNGLTMTGKNVQLGGTLVQPTTIATSATNTISLTGSPVGTAADSLLTVNTAGVVRKIAFTSPKLAVVTTAATSFTIPDTANVVIYNGTAAATFTLPAASAHYGRELRILNFAAAVGNTVVTLSTPIIVEGSTTAVTDTRINSKSSSYTFPAGISSQVMNTVTLISNGTSWYKLGN